MIRNTLNVGILFATLEQLMIHSKKYKTGAKVADKVIDISAAGIAKCFSILITNPFYLLKTRAESGQVNTSNPILSHISQIYKANGFLGFYKGFWATVIRDVPYQSIQFGIYKLIGEAINAFDVPVSNSSDSSTKSKFCLST